MSTRLGTLLSKGRIARHLLYFLVLTLSASSVAAKACDDLIADVSSKNLLRYIADNLPSDSLTGVYPFQLLKQLVSNFPTSDRAIIDLRYATRLSSGADFKVMVQYNVVNLYNGSGNAYDPQSGDSTDALGGSATGVSVTYPSMLELMDHANLEILVQVDCWTAK